jgi:hypothetical protein
MNKCKKRQGHPGPWGINGFLEVIDMKKRLAVFPSLAGMSQTKLFLAENDFLLFSARESLVSDIPAGDGKIVNFFYSVLYM